MNVAKLVSKVATAILREELQPEAGGAQTTARFALNLNPEHVAAIAHAVLADPFLNEKIKIKLPKSYVGDYSLPEEALTTNAATFYRNADCPKSAFLLAEVEHDEEASLNEVARLGPPELIERIPLWVRAASTGLGIALQQQNWWEKALTGLRDLRIVSLDRFASYVLRTQHEIHAEGRSILHALGAALPALHLPCDSSYFEGIKERSRGHASAWKAHIQAAQKRRAGLLLKQTSGQLLLSEEELRAAFEKVRHQIPELYHTIIEDFIAAPGGWNDQAEALAECEWEEVRPTFDGLQREHFDLGRNTLVFYDDREPELITDEEREYLNRLIGRKTSEDIEEDANFYEAHRNELKEDRKLKSAWDRFVYGRPVEATDFLAGLCAAIEPLYNRMPSGHSRKLRVRCESATKRDLRNLNVDAGLYFAHRYAGLKRLLGNRVEWDVGELFNFKTLVEGWKSTGTKPNTSTAKTALQLKFVIELESTTDLGAIQAHSAQLVWRHVPSSVSSELSNDWGRLAQKPFLRCRTSREFSGDRAIDLSNVKTFMPAYDRDRGSFVPVYKKEKDIAAAWRTSLKDCVDQGYLSPQNGTALEAAFGVFEGAYTTAIREFPEKGGGAAAVLEQATAYTQALDAVVILAKGDRNRDKLLKPLLEIGVVPIDGGSAAAVVAPWHPMRLAAIWRKSHLAVDLIGRILASKDPQGDTKLFFRDLEQDFKHPLYPELVPVWTAGGTQLLSTSDALGDYSLHVPPVAEAEGDTNESPTEGSTCVIDLVRRYLALHPHERANLSVVLFNCDSARLPQAVVEKIGDIQDDDEDVRCQVLLRT